MNVKQFSVVPSVLGSIATAVKMHNLGNKYINQSQYDLICLSIGRDFVADMSTEGKAEKIIAAAEKYADKAAEHAEVQL